MGIDGVTYTRPSYTCTCGFCGVWHCDPTSSYILFFHFHMNVTLACFNDLFHESATIIIRMVNISKASSAHVSSFHLLLVDTPSQSTCHVSCVARVQPHLHVADVSCQIRIHVLYNNHYTPYTVCVEKLCTRNIKCVIKYYM